MASMKQVRYLKMQLGDLDRLDKLGRIEFHKEIYKQTTEIIKRSKKPKGKIAREAREAKKSALKSLGLTQKKIDNSKKSFDELTKITHVMKSREYAKLIRNNRQDLAWDIAKSKRYALGHFQRDILKAGKKVNEKYITKENSAAIEDYYKKSREVYENPVFKDLAKNTGYGEKVIKNYFGVEVVADKKGALRVSKNNNLGDYNESYDLMTSAIADEALNFFTNNRQVFEYDAIRDFIKNSRDPLAYAEAATEYIYSNFIQPYYVDNEDFYVSDSAFFEKAAEGLLKHLQGPVQSKLSTR